LDAFHSSFVFPFANGQRHDNWPKPPEPAVRTQDTPNAGPHVERQDAAELAHAARELDELAGTIPADIEQVKKGLLPKDTIEKLKRIEKLARKLRGEVGH
jgi:hypothetical protein